MEENMTIDFHPKRENNISIFVVNGKTCKFVIPDEYRYVLSISLDGESIRVGNYTSGKDSIVIQREAGT